MTKAKNIEQKDLGLQSKSPSLKEVRSRQRRSAYKPTSEQAGNIFTELYLRIVDQSIENTLANIDYIEGFVDKENWINGVKEYVIQGLYDIKDYTWAKANAISDINPAVLYAKSVVYKTDKVKLIEYKYFERQLINTFTSPARTVEFVENLVKREVDSVQKYLEENRAKFVLGQANDSGQTLVYDKTIRTDNLLSGSPSEEDKILEILARLEQEVVSLRVPQNDYLKLDGWNSGDKAKIWYSAKPDNFKLLVNSSFYINALKIRQRLFNPNKLFGSITDFKVLPFEKFISANPEKYKFILFDKRKLKEAYFVNSLRRVIAGFNFDYIVRRAWEFTFLGLPFYAAIEFKDN